MKQKSSPIKYKYFILFFKISKNEKKKKKKKKKKKPFKSLFLSFSLLLDLLAIAKIIKKK